jgi:uncharacterized protein (TIGR03086 family)
MLDLQPPADQVVTLLRGVQDDHLDDPTPCPGTSVANLLAHLLGLSIAFRDAARKIDGPTTSTPPDASQAELPDDWRTLLPRHLDELVAAWREPAAWEGHTQAGGVPLPGAVAGEVANNELLLHGWDLAVATAQPFAAAEDNLQSSWEMVSNTPDTPEARDGLFGPVVTVSADATLLDRTLGHAGRDPHWSSQGSVTNAPSG